MRQHGTSALGVTYNNGQHIQQQQEDGFHPISTQFDDTNVPVYNDLGGKQATSTQISNAKPETTVPTTILPATLPIVSAPSMRKLVVFKEKKKRNSGRGGGNNNGDSHQDYGFDGGLYNNNVVGGGANNFGGSGGHDQQKQDMNRGVKS